MIGVSGYIEMNRDYLTNVLFGVTFLNLALVGLAALKFQCSFLALVRLGALSCNLLMGVALLFNKKSVSGNMPLYKPYWLGMIICNIIIVKQITPHCSYPGLVSSFFIIGLSVVLVSIVSMGKSFSVTPMISKIRTRFAYSYVRHPMYLGESLMLASCTVTSNLYLSMPVFLFYMYFVVKRIKEEELLLQKSESYRKYCSDTPWRLFPYVW